MGYLFCAAAWFLPLCGTPQRSRAVRQMESNWATSESFRDSDFQVLCHISHASMEGGREEGRTISRSWVEFRQVHDSSIFSVSVSYFVTVFCSGPCLSFLICILSEGQGSSAILFVFEWVPDIQTACHARSYEPYLSFSLATQTQVGCHSQATLRRTNFMSSFVSRTVAGLESLA